MLFFADHQLRTHYIIWQFPKKPLPAKVFWRTSRQKCIDFPSGPYFCKGLALFKGFWKNHHQDDRFSTNTVCGLAFCIALSYVLLFAFFRPKKTFMLIDSPGKGAQNLIKIRSRWKISTFLSWCPLSDHWIFWNRHIYIYIFFFLKKKTESFDFCPGSCPKWSWIFWNRHI